jgi:hypothetical protein
MRHGATHILREDVCDRIICVMRQDHLEDSLIVIAICNLRDLPSIWWSTTTIIDLFYASPFYLYA